VPPGTAERLHRALLAKFALRRDVGNFHWLRGEHAAALAHFEARLAEAPDDVPSLKQAAFCAYHLKEAERALDFARRALAVGPDFEMARPRTSGSSAPSRRGGRAFRAPRLDPRDYLSRARRRLLAQGKPPPRGLPAGPRTRPRRGGARGSVRAPGNGEPAVPAGPR
jgi:tetratricopeptide (TPR) repeat protein